MLALILRHDPACARTVVIVLLSRQAREVRLRPMRAFHVPHVFIAHIIASPAADGCLVRPRSIAPESVGKVVEYKGLFHP